ncbi:MAG TPA: response regulator [Phycisphaerae bacterium]|nr:response regulator [Phycisphaerae bacterium]HOQ84709.1 response regulator [Phycisphaerae bacterium]HPP26305.1 response regulator [Phycisphaerae bacterium]HQA00387.1 response regulator [Phycisphaerae bacterium]HQE26978.1 response regulator [Phycisphaerae bacterium]
MSTREVVRCHRPASATRVSGTRKPAQEQRSAAATAGRVMIVDDDRSFVEALAIFLEDNGFQVVTAFTGRECIDTLQWEKLDLAVVDFHLPDTKGIEVVNRLLQWQPSVPVLLISSDDSPETAAHGLAPNVRTSMLKPVIPKQLLDTISRLCRNASGGFSPQPACVPGQAHQDA